jgi:hypothetical protein
MTIDNSRRSALVSLGALAVGAAAVAAGRPRAATTDQIIPPGAVRSARPSLRREFS